MARPEAAAKRKEEGGRQISASFTKHEIDLLDRVRRKGGFDTNKSTLIAALKALDAGGDRRAPLLSKPELIAELSRRMK